MEHYLQWFDENLKPPNTKGIRAFYHDSYEYRTDWSPDFLEQFARYRGYRLENELPSLFGSNFSDQVARVKQDYRETISDIMVEETLPLWVRWAHERGILTRNEAHGSPGNWLDLYALADIPETEMFNKDRNRLVSKFASSAAHVNGRRLVASETGTWLREHFNETLADMKYLIDDLFLSGVNHIFYHGSCYSPEDAAWPGWLFYASFEMNSRNSIWRDVPVLNHYASRCQAEMQASRSDNDILLYWPIHDYWQNPTGMVQNITVHARSWFEEQAVGRLAAQFWKRGFSFDYISDRQILFTREHQGAIQTRGASYRAIVIPKCRFIPVDTMAALLSLAEAGASVIFEDSFPEDVPGWGDLALRRTQLSSLLHRVEKVESQDSHFRKHRFGLGTIRVGAVEPALEDSGIQRETMVDIDGLNYARYIFSNFSGGHLYFIANRGTQPVENWIDLATPSKSVLLLDPMNDDRGFLKARKSPAGSTQVYLQLAPGQSVLLRAFNSVNDGMPHWTYPKPSGDSISLKGPWNVQFIQGGPELPQSVDIPGLTSWTTFNDSRAASFAGSAKYSIQFDLPSASVAEYLLDLGDVRHSARVRINGKDCGSLITSPFRLRATGLTQKNNRLEIEVTSTAANRIRDMDRRGVKWKIFNDINMVNIDYKPFDASQWPLAEAGLLGPVSLIPAVFTGEPDR